MKQDLAKILDLREACADKRVLVVGDPHGCFEELQELLHTFDWRMSQDILIITGDLLDRGPDIYRLVNFVRHIENVYTVDSNHEDKFRRWMKGGPVYIGEELQSSIDQLKPELDRPRQRAELLQWLEDLPQIIRIRDDTYVVHAGIDPSFPMDQQTRQNCRYLRSLEPAWVPEGDTTTRPAMWYEHFRQGDQDPTILFGHSTHENPYTGTSAIALDGGCVFGGELRGIEILPNHIGLSRSVKAKKIYYKKERTKGDE